jgi:hypothetical protein
MLRKRFAILFALIGIGASAGTAQPRPKGAILATPILRSTAICYVDGSRTLDEAARDPTFRRFLLL